MMSMIMVVWMVMIVRVAVLIAVRVDVAWFYRAVD